jgi:uncharacterized membrane protein
MQSRNVCALILLIAVVSPAAVTKAMADRIADAIKADDVSPRLQKEFVEKATRPLEAR